MKGYHVYQLGRPGQALSCEREAHNPHSEVAIAYRPVTIDDSVIDHIPDCLAAVLETLLDSGRVANITGSITGQ